MYLPVSVCVPVWLLFTLPFFLSLFHLFIFSWHHNFSYITHFLNFPSLSVSQFPSLPLISVSFRYLFPLSPLPGFLSFHFFPSDSFSFPLVPNTYIILSFVVFSSFPPSCIFFFSSPFCSVSLTFSHLIYCHLLLHVFSLIVSPFMSVVHSYSF